MSTKRQASFSRSSHHDQTTYEVNMLLDSPQSPTPTGSGLGAALASAFLGVVLFLSTLAATALR